MAYNLSSRSKSRLEGVEEDLVKVVERAIELTEVDFGVIQGLRTMEEQKSLVAKGASKTMKSKHLEGKAVDLMAYIDGRGSWELNVYDEIADEDLPWAQIVVPITHTVHRGNGQTLGLLVGAQVFGIFLDGQNSQLPLVVGSIPKDDGEKSDTIPKSSENYPHNKVYNTESGHYKEYDDTPEKERIKEQHQSGTHWEITNDTFTIKHNSGSSISMDKDGNVTISASGNGELIFVGKSVRLNS